MSLWARTPPGDCPPASSGLTWQSLAAPAALVIERKTRQSGCCQTCDVWPVMGCFQSSPSVWLPTVHRTWPELDRKITVGLSVLTWLQSGGEWVEAAASGRRETGGNKPQEGSVDSVRSWARLFTHSLNSHSLDLQQSIKEDQVKYTTYTRWVSYTHVHTHLHKHRHTGKVYVDITL